MTRCLIVPEDVAGADDPARTFAAYCQQRLGTPYPPMKDLVILKRKAKDFFAANPRADWFTLCRVVDWCKNRKRRPPSAWTLFSWVKYAWADGCLPELDPDGRDPAIERALEQVLSLDIGEYWTQRLATVQGPDAQRRALEEWSNEFWLWFALSTPRKQPRSKVARREALLTWSRIAFAISAFTATSAPTGSTASSSESSSGTNGRRQPNALAMSHE